MKIIISGALGRMGQILAQAAKTSGIEIVCGVDAALKNQTANYPLVKTYDEIREKADVVIDFPSWKTLMRFCDMPWTPKHRWCSV